MPFSSESWYGVGADVGTVETQIRYSGAASPAALARRWRAALRVMPHAGMEREMRAGRFWLRSALALLLLGLVLAEDLLMAAGLAALAFVAVAWAWDQLSLVGLRYARHFRVEDGGPGFGDETRAFLGESVAFTLTLRNAKPLPLMSVQIEDSFPTTLPVEGARVDFNRVTHRDEFRSFWMPGAAQQLARRYTVRCTQRGYHVFGPARLTTGDGAGLFSRTVTLADEQTLIVYPRLYSVADLRLPAKNPFGERGSKERLFEDPLRTAGIRPWQPGDGPKRVHWKATAKYQKLLSRQYEPSEEPQVLIFLNVATLARHWEGVVPELMERAISVAGSLAALCVEQRLPVGLVANAYWPGSDQSMRCLPGRSPDQLTRILEMLAAIDLPNRPIEAQLLREAPRLPWGATLLVVTAVAHPELLAALVRLSRAGRKVVLFTLAEEPPEDLLLGVTVYHLPHLVDDLVAPRVFDVGLGSRGVRSRGVRSRGVRSRGVRE